MARLPVASALRPLATACGAVLLAGAAPPDSPGQARGRRILSTALVWTGPGGVLTVALHDGSRLTLRDVTLGPRRYCGVRVTAAGGGRRLCADYAGVAAAVPGATLAEGVRAL